MTNLGDAFPKGFMKAFAANRALKVSDVIYLHCDFTTPQKYKYMVVCCCEPLLVLLINSEISPYINTRPDLLACQVDILQGDHDFLEYDSFVNCIEAHQAFELETIKAKIEVNYQRIIKGSVIDYCMREVYQAVARSKPMKRSHKRLILEALSEYQ
ncbi:hypothetical protein ID854_13380 [Xenorhabdus sp. M]|uniref:Uncharacterized protein n=1 Tax=Xenorhabdus szentirmaii TaxID=290112 RepID=A0AAW3YXG7_9GAMM|nr:hypothetical protein [Xenorhabdus sp. M]MBD2801422.1 hypothetical protein [Xenorhabdus sp. M]